MFKRLHELYINFQKDISESYFWPTLQHDVTIFCQSCHLCQLAKPNLRPKKPPLGLSETATRPYEIYAFDLIECPKTDHGHWLALVGLDLFSKRVYAVSLRSKDSFTVGQHIERIVLGNPVLPRTILTDNGTEFAMVDVFCMMYKIRHSIK